jgi:FkbM family methyltransferase
MSSGVDLCAPYGATARGFQRKNIFADQLRLLGAGSRTIVDVGAHHGEEVGTYLAMFPEAAVHAVEPTPASLDALRAAYGHHARVRIHGLALAERNGEATLHTYPSSEINALTPYVATGTLLPAETSALIVPTRTLDGLAVDEGIATIDLLKLDSQGAELRVLAGATDLLGSGRVRLIALEVLFVPLYENQANVEHVIAVLRGVGYSLYDWYNFSYDDTGQVLFGDAMFLPVGRAAHLPPPHELAGAGTLQEENERLRAAVAHLERRIERYRSKLQNVRRRASRGESATQA